MATLLENLGENIKRLRMKKGLSQIELGAKAKLDMTTISDIEIGKRNTSVLTLNKIAKALGTPLKNFFD